MAKKNKTEEQFAQVEQALSKTEQYIEENKNSLMINTMKRLQIKCTDHLGDTQRPEGPKGRLLEVGAQ